MLCFKMNLNYACIEICIDRVNLSFKTVLGLLSLSKILMCVLLYFLICTAARAHNYSCC